MTPSSPIFPPPVDPADHHNDLLPTPAIEASSSSFSLPPHLCPILFNSSNQDHGGGSFDREKQKRPKQLFYEAGLHGRSVGSPSLSSLEKDFKLSFAEGEENESVSWMSPKMSFMMNYDQQKQPSSPPNSENIRVCNDCNTTKTPLWRSGPKGPKSLCNACGIRQRKARRAMAAATAGTSNTTMVSTEISSKSGKNHVPQCKKQCKLTPRRRKKLGFEDLVINLTKNSAFHRVFPNDETEAAILLMALSCGLVSD